VRPDVDSIPCGGGRFIRRRYLYAGGFGSGALGLDSDAVRTNPDPGAPLVTGRLMFHSFVQFLGTKYLAIGEPNTTDHMI
jgi:hypothetical protein